ncbi:hypothetical protein COV56_02565 [Candidatus Kuenenbacteria bacterium CG11_big_fil_rev_8_21_14_0_20_37_9]|uniref:Glycosyltransferase 2-like domain-containing protein n=2 Tax=Candidatus Kueneniibacteriota TaxID=1752740 RepID=A0A2M6XST1_9BACT|nr:MAG: hypothetical protein AUJ29_00935 [Candidatus Kuenenbacteria bacterium CG1_02_38_13]PIR05481.1 MAG: hypothetical protein COV56_02565 [Candidatus Kuenenbacteria bacterium CG11_big_fil_rev_8_21_14_0_20_37_9]PIU10703.1 MAG: hypothetical protein COT27_01740 [Candidatus Kuenenbacteria bacterium CG08_land_8_20_14_0_20_37_23]
MSKVYIIIVTWNSGKYLSELFLSLRDLAYPKENWHLVVVDNASKDDTVEKLRQWQIKMHNFDKLIVNEKNKGFSGGNNQGIKYALEHGADYSVLLNGDAVVTPNFLDILVTVMSKDDRLGIAQPLIMRYPEKNKVNNFGNCLNYCGFGYSFGDGMKKEDFLRQFKSENYEPAYCSFSAVVIKSQVFGSIGLLDELYFAYHEDTDFCLRARLAGWHLLAIKNAIVYHNYKFPADKNKIRYYWMEKNRMYLLFKFYKVRTWLLILPAIIPLELGLIIFSLLRGFALERAKAHLWVWKNFKSVLRGRKEIQTTRQYSDAKVFEFCSPVIEFQKIKNPLLDKIGNPFLKMYFRLIKKFIK